MLCLQVTKKRARKHPVPVAAHTAALSADQLQALFEAECELALTVRGEERKRGEERGRKRAMECLLILMVAAVPGCARMPAAGLPMIKCTRRAAPCLHNLAASAGP